MESRASGNGVSDFQVRRYFWHYCCLVVGLFLLLCSEGRDGLGVQVGQRNGETTEDGIVSESVCNPFILPLQRSCDLAGGGELIGWCSVRMACFLQTLSIESSSDSEDMPRPSSALSSPSPCSCSADSSSRDCSPSTAILLL